MNKETLTQMLLEIPATVRTQELNLLILAKNQLETNEAISDIESGYKAEISMNLSLKNEGQRKAALEIDLRGNTEYQKLIEKKPEIDMVVKKAQIELEFQRNMLRSYLAIAGMLNGSEAQT